MGAQFRRVIKLGRLIDKIHNEAGNEITLKSVKEPTFDRFRITLNLLPRIPLLFYTRVSEDLSGLQVIGGAIEVSLVITIMIARNAGINSIASCYVDGTTDSVTAVEIVSRRGMKGACRELQSGPVCNFLHAPSFSAVSARLIPLFPPVISTTHIVTQY